MVSSASVMPTDGGGHAGGTLQTASIHRTDRECGESAAGPNGACVSSLMFNIGSVAVDSSDRTMCKQTAGVLTL